MAWKYIILQVGNAEVPIIFPKDLIHAEVARAMQSYYVRVAVQCAPKGVLSDKALSELRGSIKAVSAGELTLDVGACTGRSDTLGVSSRPEDERVIAAHPYTHGL